MTIEERVIRYIGYIIRKVGFGDDFVFRIKIMCIRKGIGAAFSKNYFTPFGNIADMNLFKSGTT